MWRKKSCYCSRKNLLHCIRIFRLYQGLQHVALLHPLAATGRCIVRDLSIHVPTHILEISGSYTGLNGLKLVLPCHGIVYAANCANFPPLPPSSPVPSITTTTNESTIDLPVVKFQVPSCRTYMLLHEYLHTKRGERLVFQLLDLPPTPPSQRLDVNILVERMTKTSVGPARLEGLVERTGILQDVANNAYALGITDHDFWKNLNFAHSVVVQAIQVSSMHPLLTGE